MTWPSAPAAPEVRPLDAAAMAAWAGEAARIDAAVRAEMGDRYSHEGWSPGHFLAERPGKWDHTAAAFDGGRMAGFVVASRDAREVHVHRLAVVPEHRGRGLARSLMAWVERTARERGARRISLSVAADNEAVVRLYESLGYVRVGGEMLRDYATRRSLELDGDAVRADGRRYLVLSRPLDPRAAAARRVLAVGAHLDDIELGCGGTLARAAAEGHCVRMICLSDSAYTDFEGRVLRTRAEAWREGLAAADALGCGDLEILDFPTKDVPDGSEVVEALDRRIAAFRPDVIFTHWPFDTHQAHRGAALATISASRRQNTILMYDPVFPAGRSFVGFRPQVYVDISEAIDRKLEALRRHGSQYRKYGEDWIEGVRTRARFRGYEMETSYAEAFELVRMELVL